MREYLLHTEHAKAGSAMVRNTQREGFVQALRVAAGKCGVVRVHRTAGRPLVTGMMEQIRLSDGPADVKAVAERDFATWEATFAAEAVGPLGEVDEEGEEAGEAEENEGGAERADGEGEEGDGVSFDYRRVLLVFGAARSMALSPPRGKLFI